MLVCMFNKDKSLECRNGEKKIKLGVPQGLPMPGAREKENIKDFVQPYREPRKVLWLKRLRRNRRTQLRELGKLAL